MNLETRCYFNQIDLNEPSVDSYAPYIDLDVGIAEDVCERLLNAGVIDSFIIPAFIDREVKFNKV